MKYSILENIYENNCENLINFIDHLGNLPFIGDLGRAYICIAVTELVVKAKQQGLNVQVNVLTPDGVTAFVYHTKTDFIVPMHLDTIELIDGCIKNDDLNELLYITEFAEDCGEHEEEIVH